MLELACHCACPLPFCCAAVHNRVTEGKVGGLERELALLVARPFLDLYRLLLVAPQDQGVPCHLASGRQAEKICLENLLNSPALWSGWGCGVEVRAAINERMVTVSAER